MDQDMNQDQYSHHQRGDDFDDDSDQLSTRKLVISIPNYLNMFKYFERNLNSLKIPDVDGVVFSVMIGCVEITGVIDVAHCSADSFFFFPFLLVTPAPVDRATFSEINDWC